MDGALTIVPLLFCLAAGVVVYRSVDIKTVRPRTLTWYAWAIVHVVVSFAMYSEGQYAGAGLAAGIALVALSFGFLNQRRHGPTPFRQVDAMVQVGVLLGIGLWVFFNSPTVVIVACIILDLIAGIPMLRHYLEYPAKALLPAYVLWSLAGMTAVLAAGAWTSTAVAFPFYLASYNAVAATLLFLRRQKSAEPQFSKIEEL